MGSLRTVAQTDHLHSGDKLLMDPAVQVARFGVDSRACDATIVVSTETSNVRTITIQLLKQDGSDVDEVTPFMMVVFTSAAMTAYATGGSTGVAIGTDGALLAIVAKKIFHCTSEADGDWDGTWTDTGTESVAIAVILPNGKTVVSTAFANT